MSDEITMHLLKQLNKASTHNSDAIIILSNTVKKLAILVERQQKQIEELQSQSQNSWGKNVW